MSKTVAAVCVVLVGISLGAGGPASAETLHRHGSKKAVILPVSAPKGARPVSATLTVRKGKKTLAHGVRSFRAKKGAYKVTSTVKYRLPKQVQLEPDQVLAACQVATRTITSDHTRYEDYSAVVAGSAYYSGWVEVRYTGKCADEVTISSSKLRVVWQAEWCEREYVHTGVASQQSDWAAIKLSKVRYSTGEIAYVPGGRFSALPFVRSYGPVVTRESTRTVKVA